MTTALWVAFAILLALVPLSMLVEARRKKPSPPNALEWAPSIPLSYANIRLWEVELGVPPESRW